MADVPLGRAQSPSSVVTLVTPPAPPTKWPRANVRKGQRAMSCWVSPETFRQAALLCAEQDKSVQALLEEALDLVFDKYGVQRIAGADRPK
jgi:hypothetical protein